MNPEIIAVWYPHLHLAHPNSGQVSHLIEHLILSTANLKAWGINDALYNDAVITANGFTSELGCYVYFVVTPQYAKQIAELATASLGQLTIDRDTFASEVSVLRQELREAKQYINPSDQSFEAAIHTINSAALINPWFEDTCLEMITIQEVSTTAGLRMQEARVCRISDQDWAHQPLYKAVKNTIIPTAAPQTSDLIHNGSPSETVNLVYVLPQTRTENTDLITKMTQVMCEDIRFGSILKQLRQELGLVYGVSYGRNSFSGYEYFSVQVQREKLVELTLALDQMFAQPDQSLSNLQETLNRAALYSNLEWLDVCTPLQMLHQYVLDDRILSPAQLSQAILRVNPEIIKQEISRKLRAFSTESLRIIH
jgi:predicted Zn-dependent peptidase